MGVAALDVEAGLHCDSRRDNETAKLIAVGEDRVDSNVVDIEDEVDGERGCEVVDYNDSQGRNVDMGQPEDHSELPRRHAPRSLHQDTFPWGDGHASNAYLS
jgi:hypothetical protein